MDGGLGSGDKSSMGKGPKTRVCYICGRQYGLSSYEIHLKQCKELWIAREAQKDPRERKPLPEDPMLTGSPIKSKSGEIGSVSLEEANKIASDAFNNVSLSQCEFCGRTFLAEKLIIHNRSCTAENPAKRVASKEPNPATPPVSTAKKSPSQPAVGANGIDNSNSRPSSSASAARAPKASELVPELKTDGKGGLVAVAGHLGGQAGKPIRDARKSSQSSSSPTAPTASNDLTQTDTVFDVETILNRMEDLEARACEGLETMMQIVREIGELKSQLATARST